MGVAFDVPARLYVSSIADMAVDGGTDVSVDGSVRDIIVRAAESLRGGSGATGGRLCPS
jgi:hypothetical protein